MPTWVNDARSICWPGPAGGGPGGHRRRRGGHVRVIERRHRRPRSERALPGLRPRRRRDAPTPSPSRANSRAAGRHDNPDHYTALYLAREPISAVAERIQGFRGQRLTEGVFTRPDGRVEALAEIDDTGWPELVDLDDPEVLAARRIRPSRVATGDRPMTQGLALELFLGGATGLAWWSTLEAAWTNVTVFEERLARPCAAWSWSSR